MSAEALFYSAENEAQLKPLLDRNANAPQRAREVATQFRRWWTANKNGLVFREGRFVRKEKRQ